MAALADHLWQSCLCLAALAMLTLLLRKQAALIRLWMWRIAALKFLVPFALFYSIGKWLGFPVSHAANEAPAFLVTLFDTVGPLLAPAREASLSTAASLALSALLTGLAATWSLAVARQMRVERLRAHWEKVDSEYAGMTLPGMGFVKAASLTSLSMCVVGGSMLAGGVDDRQHRHEVLILNALALRQGSVVVSIAKSGMGQRTRVLADPGGVLIRNASLRDLLAIVYGVGHASVSSDQMASSYDADPGENWLFSPRYDVRVIGPVREPEKFEPYALHQVITRMLSERFGIGVKVNGKCAPPCGRYGLPLAESPL
jgi:hypothetical protein